MIKNEKDVCIVEGFRTPFVKAGTLFKGVRASELGHTVFKELIYRVDLPLDEVDELILGNVGNPPDSANIARVVALRSGLSEKVPAVSVHRNCASALEAVTSACNRIQVGAVDVALAGGAESMSNYPLLFSKDLVNVFSRWMRAKTLSEKIKTILKIRMKYLIPRISIMEGLTDPFVGLNMGQTAEVLSKEFGITRQEQDEFALNSHQKTLAAQKNGNLASEIIPVCTDQDFVQEDQGPRETLTIEKLAKLRPYFDRKYGTVTIGNSCPITDGAVALLLMSRRKAESLGLKPKAIIKSYAYAGCSPSRMGLGPVFATPIALKRAGLSMRDIKLIEINEAFAAQVLACQRAFASRRFAQEHLEQSHPVGEIDPSILNVNGGAIALGHPVGATGSRLVLTLLREMERKQIEFGLASLCVGGGQGGALILQREA